MPSKFIQGFLYKIFPLQEHHEQQDKKPPKPKTPRCMCPEHRPPSPRKYYKDNKPKWGR